MPYIGIGPTDDMPFAISIVSSTAATITPVAAVAGTIVRVYKIFLISSGTAILTFQDGTTAVSGGVPLVANGSITLSGDGTPWFTTSPGNAFQIGNTGSGVTISGNVYYTQHKTFG